MLDQAFLKITHLPHPAVPIVRYKKITEILGSLVVIVTVLGVILLRKPFYFPALVAYVLYGVGKTVFFGLIGRRPRGDVPVISDEDEDLEPDTQIVVADITPERQSRRRRRRRHHRNQQQQKPGEGDK